MAKKIKKSGGRIINRRARFDYELGETFEVGLQLTGAETKALRTGQGKLTGAYVTVKNGELWLVGAFIGSTNSVTVPEADQRRDRKLLAHRSEISRLIDAKNQGKTILPLELLVGGRYLKLKISAGKGRKRYDKREVLKRRQQERDIERQVRK